MDAAQFFRDVVTPNYNNFVEEPSNIRLLWNAVVSMNTTAEYLALDRLEYVDVKSKELDEEAKRIRCEYPVLLELMVCADTLKHVRKLRGRKHSDCSLTASSTGIEADHLDTWFIEHNGKRYLLSDVLAQAFDTLSKLPEFR